MKIIQNNQSISESLLEANRIKWDHYARNGKISLLTFAIISLIMLGMGAASFHQYDTFNNGKCKIYYNLNLFLSLGITGLIVIGYVIYRFKRNQVLFMRNMMEYARLFEHETTTVYELNEESISIDRSIQLEKKHWKLFRQITVINGIIFLQYSSKTLDGVFIDARHFSESEFNELLAFLKTKIK